MAGFLALVLHAHLPFVRHPEHTEMLEENWLFEALTETYLPLLATFQRLRAEQVPFRVALSVTPPLCAMLNDPLLRARYLCYLEDAIQLAQRELAWNRNDPPCRALAEFYLRHFRECRRYFVEEWNGDLVAVLRDLHATGEVELVACAATHGLLPLLQQSPAATRAQILIGRDEFCKNFGAEPAGFWLPECAYAPGLDAALQEANIRWSIVDAHGLLYGAPRPRRAIYAPCFSPAGPAFFGRDRSSSRQVWSATEGYPGAPAYREFYHDIGFERPASYLWPGDRLALPRFTGIKYRRVTGPGRDKELYDPEIARVTAERHAQDFLDARVTQIRDLSACTGAPIVVAPFDAELFGHWWFEGPHFLETLIRKTAHDQNEIELTTPGHYLEAYPTQQIVAPAASTWGENGHLGVWLDPSNSWIYPHLHAAAGRMSESARAHAETDSALVIRVLQQMTRELLLMQSSDWAFLMKTGTAQHYASARTQKHVRRFNELWDALQHGQVNETRLAEIEARDNLFADVNWRYYI